MEKEEIEIAPGKFILVTKKLKKKVGVGNVGFVSLEKTRRAARFVGKYSLLLLDEAVVLMKERGLKSASIATGVPRYLIKKHAGVVRTRGPNPTWKKKLQCIALAMDVMRDMGVDGTRLRDVKAAFAVAGKRMGMSVKYPLRLYRLGVRPSSIQEAMGVDWREREAGRLVQRAIDDARRQKRIQRVPILKSRPVAPPPACKTTRRYYNYKPHTRRAFDRFRRLLESPSVLAAISRAGSPSAQPGLPHGAPAHRPALRGAGI